MAIQVEVWGDYACFTRPEMKTERVSYDVMTPSAARGLLDSLYWHPGLRWVIDRIHVCAPIRFTNIRRNEVKDVISARRAKTVMEKGQGELYLAALESIQQRAAMVLRDVHMSSTRTSTRRTPLRPATIPASFRTLSSDGWKRGSVTACRISARGSFPRSSGAARNCRRAPMSSKARATSAGCCGISTTAILRTSRRSFSARALSTA